jgi:hypothetical protein
MSGPEISSLEVDSGWVTILHEKLSERKSCLNAINIPFEQIHNEWSNRKI